MNKVNLATGSVACLRNGRGDRVKIIALNKEPGVSADIKTVTANVLCTPQLIHIRERCYPDSEFSGTYLEVVIDSMDDDLGSGMVGSEVRRATGHIVEPVTRDSIPVLFSKEKHCPVMLTVAAS